MAEQQPAQGSSVNYGIVGIGVLLLVVVVGFIQDNFLRVLLATGAMLLTFWWSQARAEPEIENPILDELHQRKHEGLDRRKYGHLRASTDSLLDHVRQMNRIAIEGREGKLNQRHARAELDRLASKMRDLVDDIRKTAGVPTPEEAASRPQVAQPQVVLPKSDPGGALASPARPDPSATAATERHRPPPRRAARAGATESMLDDLEVKAEEEARSRRASREDEGSQ